MSGSAFGRTGSLLRGQLLISALKRFAGGELFLVGIMILAELFSSMWKLLAMDARLGDILVWVAAGIPARAFDVLPVALLFGVTLSLAELHADGEFLAICSSGIRLQSLSLPLVIFSLILGGLVLLAQDSFLASVNGERDRLYAAMTGQKSQSRQTANVSILARSGSVLYRAGYFDPKEERLVDIDVVVRAEGSGPVLRILAKSAQWEDPLWSFREARLFSRLADGSWKEERMPAYTDPTLDEPPSSFSALREKPQVMGTKALRAYAATLRNSGLPSAEAGTEYHKRLSFSLTPLIVCGLSIAFAGLFRKNVLLMSLLFSLSTATVYYVAQMLMAIAAKSGLIEPALAIWSVVLAFLTAAGWGFFAART